MEQASDSTSLRLPDFIIAGAMKCGTTSFRHILSHHPDVFMPDHEVFYFDIDDIQQHPNFFANQGGEWRYHDVEGRHEFYLEWYASQFAGAQRHQIVGENSTSYIASAKAPARIAQALPRVKIIVMLRDPVSRAYSHYWHLVRTGRATADFEDCLKWSAGNIVERSCYRPQVERLLTSLPRAQVHFIVFETFVSDMQSVVADALRFLGVSTDLDLSRVNTRRNAGAYPRSLAVELLRNRVGGGRPLKLPVHLPEIGLPPVKIGVARRAAVRTLRRVNPRRPTKAPPMREETRHFLNKYLARENRGLAELVGQDVDRFWWKP